MKTILCYGDSNTWGHTPGSGQRFGPDIRWPRVMATLLGPDYEIVEAGLCGRTTIWDDPFEPGLNGMETLVPVLRSASPLDLVILMLGTNDLKFKTAWDSARACNILVKQIRANAELFRGGRAQVLLVSPPLVEEPYMFEMANPSSPCSRAESLKFGTYYQQFAQSLQTPFFDAATVAAVELDGIHLGEAGHKALAAALAAQVRAII